LVKLLGDLLIIDAGMSSTFCCCCQYGRNVEKLSPQQVMSLSGQCHFVNVQSMYLSMTWCEMQATCGGSCCGAGWLYCLFYHFGLAVVPQCITRGEIRRMNGLQVCHQHSNGTLPVSTYV